MSAHGNDGAALARAPTALTNRSPRPGASMPARAVAAPGRRSGGFTLIELMVVVAIIALATGLVVLALRDPDASRLDQEATRLAALLESARAESRTAGTPVAWLPVQSTEAQAANGPADFRFVGLAPGVQFPMRWLTPQTSADLLGARALRLGPEPFIGPQRVLLRLGSRRLEVATDGLSPFAVVGGDEEPGR